MIVGLAVNVFRLAPPEVDGLLKVSKNEEGDELGEIVGVLDGAVVG